ncbi:hypothetical protein E4U58_004547 [Claviceps cyperi]|nr:hypothetical protein E4U58_004547 [Claviceps cyperi]
MHSFFRQDKVTIKRLVTLTSNESIFYIAATESVEAQSVRLKNQKIYPSQSLQFNASAVGELKKIMSRW